MKYVCPITLALALGTISGPFLALLLKKERGNISLITKARLNYESGYINGGAALWVESYLAHFSANECFIFKTIFVVLVNVPIALSESGAAFLVQFWQRNELSIFNRFSHITVWFDSANKNRKLTSILLFTRISRYVSVYLLTIRATV